MQTLSRIQHAITFWFRWIWCVSLFQEQIDANSTIKAILMSLPAWALDSRTQDRSNLWTTLKYLLAPGVSFASTQLSDPAHSLTLPCSHSSRFLLKAKVQAITTSCKVLAVWTQGEERHTMRHCPCWGTENTPKLWHILSDVRLHRLKTFCIPASQPFLPWSTS